MHLILVASTAQLLRQHAKRKGAEAEAKAATTVYSPPPQALLEAATANPNPNVTFTLTRLYSKLPLGQVQMLSALPFLFMVFFRF